MVTKCSTDVNMIRWIQNRSVDTPLFFHFDADQVISESNQPWHDHYYPLFNFLGCFLTLQQYCVSYICIVIS